MEISVECIAQHCTLVDRSTMWPPTPNDQPQRIVRRTSLIDDAADAAADYSTETEIKIAELLITKYFCVFSLWHSSMCCVISTINDFAKSMCQSVEIVGGAFVLHCFGFRILCFFSLSLSIAMQCPLFYCTY